MYEVRTVDGISPRLYRKLDGTTTDQFVLKGQTLTHAEAKKLRDAWRREIRRDGLVAMVGRKEVPMSVMIENDEWE